MVLSRTEIKNRLADIMSYAVCDLNADINNLDESAELINDLGLNSVGVLYVVIAIEEAFSIEFENVGFSDFKTLGDVIDYIEGKLNA